MQVFPVEFKEAIEDPVLQERREIYDKIMAGSEFTIKNCVPLLMELVNRFPTTLELCFPLTSTNISPQIPIWKTAKSLCIDEHAICSHTTQYRVSGFPNNM